MAPEQFYRLDGRVALIAGASSGLGEGFARLLAAAGARVVLGARRLERVEAIAAELVAQGHEAMGVHLDVTDDASIIAAFDAAEARYGTADTVIANAATGTGGRSTEAPVDGLRPTIATNFTAVYLVAREAARRLIASGSREKENGRILFTGSITALQHHTGDNAYAACKAAIAHLAKQFAKEWARQGINVNVIQPGWIRTPINDDWFASDRARQDIAGLPRRRMQEQSALDDMVLYLCSDRSRQVTGSVFTLDDGQSL
ncbi:MAG TPA: SDR family oxidoreductase [Novosphingobium sp.]|nr:SDR family oxidoreductase [Novosphingobium sp.]